MLKLFVACSGTHQPFIYTVATLPGPRRMSAIATTSAMAQTASHGARLTIGTGTHATHYKARYNGSNYTVVGQ